MTRTVFLMLALLCSGLAGCLDDQNSLPFVRRDPFGLYKPTEQKPIRLDPAPSTKEAHLRVNLVGQNLVSVNELHKVGLRPIYFRVIGAPQVAIFHRATQELFLTEGLVKLCDTKDKLAAVMALEMGAMVSEREAIARPEAREKKRLPPIDNPIGNDLGGNFGPADGVRLAELARYEKETKSSNSLPPDPKALARTYLIKAGYDVKALKAVEPILKKANRNVRLERQLKSTPPRNEAWKPAEVKKPQPETKPAL